MTTQARISPAVRAVTVLALLIAVAAAAVIVIGNRPAYTVRVDFQDAGQLVVGDLVEVGGIPVGSVTALNLTHDSEAQVTISLGRGRFTPLHQGTTASIATVGLSGVTNRFVALAPGPLSRPAIRSGGVIPTTDTTPIVDIDELLDTVTPPVRQNLRNGIQEAAKVLHGNVAGLRQTLKYAAAATERSGTFIGEVIADQPAFSGLLSSGATTAQTLSSQSAALTDGVAKTASALGAIADSQSALADGLTRAPAVLDQGTAFLQQLRPTLVALDPVLRDAAPVAGPVAGVLRRFVPVATATIPLLRRLDTVLPSLTAALRQLPALDRAAVPALAQTTVALEKAEPIFAGLRPYGEDILLGFLHGYCGGSSENYDANGQFSRISLGLPASTLLTAELGFNLPALSPHLLTNQLNKCPGSAAEPAPDGTNRVVADGCNPLETP
jgi:phospholipid/cholesterol/gamma-HCH transport system substrate-binding protein